MSKNRINNYTSNNFRLPKWLSLTEASIYTGLSKATLRRNIYKGNIRCNRSVGKILIRRDEIDRFLDE